MTPKHGFQPQISKAFLSLEVGTPRNTQAKIRSDESIPIKLKSSLGIFRGFMIKAEEAETSRIAPGEDVVLVAFLSLYLWRIWCLSLKNQPALELMATWERRTKAVIKQKQVKHVEQTDAERGNFFNFISTLPCKNRVDNGPAMLCITSSKVGPRLALDGT